MYTLFRLTPRPYRYQPYTTPNSFSRDSTLTHRTQFPCNLSNRSARRRFLIV